MHCHEVDYKIIGHDIQMVEIALDPGETVIAEAGTMTYLEQDICFDTKLGDGSSSGVMGKLFGLGKRMLTGESVFLSYFTNEGKQKRHTTFAAPCPGSVISLNLAQLNQAVICQKDAFLAAAFGTRVDIALHKKLGAGFFGGKGLFLATLSGTGSVWIQSMPFSRLAERILSHSINSTQGEN